MGVSEELRDHAGTVTSRTLGSRETVEPRERDSAPRDIALSSVADPPPTAGTHGRPALASTRARLWAADVVVLALIWTTTMLVVATVSAHGSSSFERALAVAAPVAATLVALALLGRRWSSFGDREGIDVRSIVESSALAAVVAAAIAPSLGLHLGLGTSALAGVLAAGALVTNTYLFRARYRRLAGRGELVRPVVLIGSGPGGRHFANVIARDRYLGYRIDAVIGTSAPRGGWPVGVPWYSEIDDLERVLEIVGDREVFVALEDEHPTLTRTIVDRLVDHGVPVRAWSALTASGSVVSSGVLGTNTVFHLETRRRSRWRLALKRGFDIVAAGALLLVASPIIGVAAIFIRREDGGPVLFRQIRVGRDGDTFELLKLRTMNVDAERQLIDLTFENERTGGPLFKLVDDPRRTDVGRRLERLSIDELPQLWNVVRGDMSLVGPRPALPSEVETFDTELLRRHLVTPGITGLWQLHARDNPSFDEYKRLDLNYVERWSLALDLGIFFRTVGSVFRRAFRRRRPEPVVDLTTENGMIGLAPTSAAVTSASIE